MQLTKREKNQVFEALVAGGLDPADCELTINLDVYISYASSLFFVISPPGGLAATYNMTINGPRNADYATGEWEGVIHAIQNWAADIKRWLETLEDESDIPDLWEDLRHRRDTFSVAQYEDVSNTRFTADEQAEVSRTLNEIKRNVSETYSLTSEQMSRVEARLNEAEAASRHMGRREWMTLFYGTLFTLILSGVLTPETVQHILALVLHGLGHLFGIEVTPQLPPVT